MEKADIIIAIIIKNFWHSLKNELTVDFQGAIIGFLIAISVTKASLAGPLVCGHP